MVCKSVIDPVGHAVAPHGHPEGAGQRSSLYHQPTETSMHMQDWQTGRQSFIAGVAIGADAGAALVTSTRTLDASAAAQEG
jgi:hypothetical protein